MSARPWSFDDLFDEGPVVIVRAVVEPTDGGLDATTARRQLRDATRTTLEMTRNSEQVLGFTAAEVPSVEAWVARIHPDDRLDVTTSWDHRDPPQIGTRLRYRLRHGDGTYRWIESLGTIRHGEQDEVVAFVSDVTEQHEAEEQLRTRERQLSNMFDGAPAQIYAKDLEGRYLLCNADVLGLWGLRSKDVVGRTDHDLWPEFADSYRENDRIVAERGTATVSDEVVTIDGEERTYLSLKFPLRDASGAIYATAGVSADISRRADDLRALQQARDAAERANAAKSEFLSRMSHELRTPLNSVLGFAQLLDLGDLDEKQRQNVALILTAGRHLLELINEVLDITRIEAGRLPISIEQVDLAETVRAAIDLVRPAAADASISIATGIGAPAAVVADRQRTLQILLNLLSNAVKYNRPGGSVTVTAVAAGTCWRVEVADTGRGIQPEHHDAVFAVFERPGTDHGTIEGSGVGLALSKSLVELMGGTIGVRSEPGVGSTFWFELPAAGAPVEHDDPDDGEPPPPDTARSLVVLCIEDNPANVELVAQVFALRPGVELVSTDLGARGAELARTHRPDLILLDLNLPDISGEEVLAELQRDPALRTIATVVLTADVTPGQRDRLLAAGASGYLTKPFDVRELLALVDEATLHA